MDATDMKPLFAMEAWTGENLSLFEAGATTQFFIYNRIEGSLYRINAPNTLEDIVELLGDEDKGLTSLAMEQVV